MDYYSIALVLIIGTALGYGILMLRRLIVSNIGQEKFDFTVSIIENIVRYCEQMGLNLGWTGEEKETARRYSYSPDIGKDGIGHRRRAY